jgi:hypothetical protein
MEHVEQMIVDYYRSAEFRNDLATWVVDPGKSVRLREHIVRQMNTNRAALGRALTDDLELLQKRFVSGAMSYDDLAGFVESYVATIRLEGVPDVCLTA